MATPENSRITVFQRNPALFLRNGGIIEKISWFEQQRPDEDRLGDVHGVASDRMQSSACFDAWAFPDIEIDGNARR